MVNKAKISICSRTFYKNHILRSELKKMAINVKFNQSDTTLKGRDLIKFLKGSEIALVGLEKIDSLALSQSNKLKTIVKYGVGLDKIDLEYLRKNKIKLFHFPGFNKRSVSELALSFMLSISRDLNIHNSLVKNNEWRQFMGENLSEKKIGIIGCGFAGKDLIKLLKPFNCKIYVNDIINISSFAKKNKIIVKSKKKIFSECDFISLHIPFNSKNKKLISKKYFRLMKSTASILNTSRGGIVDENDLYEVLKNKSIKSAYFDVLEKEPPKKNYKILKLENFFISPHIGGSTRQSILKGGLLCIKKIAQLTK